MSRVLKPPPRQRPCFPRVSGDEPEDGELAIEVNKFSPREWG